MARLLNEMSSQGWELVQYSANLAYDPQSGFPHNDHFMVFQKKQ
jgi:hypothetical protein